MIRLIGWLNLIDFALIVTVAGFFPDPAGAPLMVRIIMASAAMLFLLTTLILAIWATEGRR